MSEEDKKYRFRVESNGKTLFYQGNILCEDKDFFSVLDYKVGLVRIAKRYLISQEEVK